MIDPNGDPLIVSAQEAGIVAENVQDCAANARAART
jgi:hypothetical protein